MIGMRVKMRIKTLDEFKSYYDCVEFDSILIDVYDDYVKSKLYQELIKTIMPEKDSIGKILKEYNSILKKIK